MRLLICAGGTGGGVYPALAILQALGKHADPVLWVGSVEGMEADLVHRMGLPYQAIPAAGLHGVGIRSLPGNLIKLIRGYFASKKVIKQFCPDVLLFTGGYVAIPMALAGRKLPSVLFVPDIEPGLALRTLSRFADKIAITAEQSTKYYRNDKKLFVTGYPTRSDLQEWTRVKGLKKFKLSQKEPVLLVLGGSKGARSINRALLQNLEELLTRTQVIHISGQLDWDEVNKFCEGLPHDLKTRYHAFPYLHEEMGAAFTVADLVLSRAGASTLGEYPQFGLPAILVPYPYAWRYQKVNADHLVQNGGAMLITNEDLAGKMLPVVTSLLTDKKKLKAMSAAMRSLYSPKAAQQIAALVSELALKGAK